MRTATIYETKDYSIFKFLLGNRAITPGRLAIIRKSIETVGYISNPIIINEKYEIIDGQGRFLVLKELGLPVEYIIQPGLTIVHCQAMNLKPTSWSTEDFVKSYADVGNENYQRLKNLHDQFGFSYTTITAIKYGFIAVGGSCSDIIKNGNLILTENNMKELKNILTYLTRFKDISKLIGGRTETLYSSIAFCYRCDNCNAERLVEVLHNRANQIHPVARGDKLITEIETIYNYSLKKKDRIYFGHLYETR